MTFSRDMAEMILNGDVNVHARMIPISRVPTGKVIKVQPGRYAKHIGHVTVVTSWEADVTHLDEEHGWVWHADRPKSGLITVMSFGSPERCDGRC